MGKYFACDFETTVDPDETFVWLAGCSELFTNQIFKFQTIEKMFEFFWKENRKYNIIAYFHMECYQKSPGTMSQGFRFV